MKEGILPCPFCGADGKLVSVSFYAAAFVRCSRCAARTAEYHGYNFSESVSLAKSAWNRRESGAAF